MLEEKSTQLNNMNDSWGTYGSKSKRKSSLRKKNDRGWGADKNSSDRSGNRTFSMRTADSGEQSKQLAVLKKNDVSSDIALTDGRYLEMIHANSYVPMIFFGVMAGLIGIVIVLFFLFHLSFLLVIGFITLILFIGGGLTFRRPNITQENRKKLKEVYKEQFVDYVLKSDYNAEKTDPNPEILPSFLPLMIYREKDGISQNSSYKVKLESQIVRHHILNSGAPIQFLQYEFVKKVGTSINEATQNYNYSESTQYACTIAVIPLKIAFKTYLRVAQFHIPLSPDMTAFRVKNNIYPPAFDYDGYNSNFIMDEFRKKTFETCVSPDRKADLIKRFYDIESCYRSSMTCAPKCRDPQNLYIKSEHFVQAFSDALARVRSKVQLFFIESNVYIVFDLGMDALNPHDQDMKNIKLNESVILSRVRNELDNMIPFCKKMADILEQLPENA